MNPRIQNQYEIDDMYSALAKIHEGLDATQSNLLNACAIFLLAAQVDQETLDEILQIARRTVAATA